jgi:hypothetical protein
MHTTASDGWPAPHELVDQARRVGLDVIAVTDHDTIEGALRAADYASRWSGVHVVVGEEVSSRNGHIVGLFLEKRIRPGMTAAATVHAIHDQGGLAVAVHPFWRTQRRTPTATVHGVGWLRLTVQLGGQVAVGDLLGEPPYLHQGRPELLLQRGVRFLDVGEHLEELTSLEDHVDREQDRQGSGKPDLELAAFVA